ncbi:MAG: response regulator transcription factor [Pyrinomonadaceae bacterium]|nr:response regulator transcription factor [Pyrinomonadaceae bacterium]
MTSNSPDNPIRILLVDDHLLVREGLRELIESRPGMVVVADTGSGSNALSLASSTQPDIIILDLDLGDDDGLTILPKLLEVSSQSSVIILTGTRDPYKRDKAMEIGAKGVVLKENGATELLSAIEKVHRTGEYWLESGAVNRLLDKRRTRAAEKLDPEAAKIASLTEREREIIALVGEGLENKEIAERLRPIVAESTVRNNLSIIYEKLDIKGGRLALLVYAYKHGLVSTQAR